MMTELEQKFLVGKINGENNWELSEILKELKLLTST
jgi:hypothetical protein